MTLIVKNMFEATMNTTTVSDDSTAGVTHVSLCVVFVSCNDANTSHMTVNAIAYASMHDNLVQRLLQLAWIQG